MGGGYTGQDGTRKTDVSGPSRSRVDLGTSSSDYFCKRQSKDVLHLALVAGKVSLQETAG